MTFLHSAPLADASDPQSFYERGYSTGQYGLPQAPENHPSYGALKEFVQRYNLHDKQCLEIGCGRGAFQNLVSDYTGVDIAEAVRPFLQKPFFACSATQLPFPDNRFDAIWTVAVLEHVPDPERALCEMRRVLRPNGLLYLAPAWQCRPWAAQGYPVRPYSDFGLTGKIVKASIPVRDSVLFRAASLFPQRMTRLLGRFINRGPTHFRYRRLTPNYSRFWTSDSDACNSMDPYEAVVWFVSRGDVCLSYPTWWSQFFVRTGAIVFQIGK
jgi:ubiquinone/menaquinone biosynthesis C-methylase UbiE